MAIYRSPTAQPLRVQAYECFQSRLVEGRIRPGQVLTQRELTELLGVPLAAVRELVPRLECEGLLRTLPQRGLQIAHVDLQLIHNAFHLRRLLEVEAGVRFASGVSDAELDQIEAAHRRIVDRARQGPVDAQLLHDATEVDWGFHKRMVEALGNGLMAEIYRVNSLRIRLIRLEGSLMSPPVLLSTMAEHLAVVRALRSRQPTEVARAIEAHVDSARHRVLGLPAPGATGPTPA